MRLNLFLRLAAIGLLLAGCSSGDQPAPTPETVEKTAEKPSEAPPAPATVSLVPKQPEPQPAAVTKSAAGGPPIRDFARKLLESDGHGGWQKNEKAATELERLSAEQVQALWPLLRDDDVEVRRGAAVFLLPLFDPGNREQAAVFTTLLDDRDRMVRARAIDAVRQFSKPDQLSTLPKLIPLLDAEHEDRPENRAAVARLCGSLKRAAEPATAALASAARYDPDAKVRAAALAAAVSVATTAPVMQALRQGLTDSEPAVRLVAASRLRQLGATATSLAPDLAKTLSDADQDVAENAAEALIAIGTPAVESLAAQLSAGNPSAKKLALAAMATLGPVAKSALPAIEKCRQDTDPQVRQLAEAALKRVNAK
jgi:HEAT repeat protein